jgi:hypothetical protein
MGAHPTGGQDTGCHDERIHRELKNKDEAAAAVFAEKYGIK